SPPKFHTGFPISHSYLFSSIDQDRVRQGCHQPVCVGDWADAPIGRCGKNLEDESFSGQTHERTPGTGSDSDGPSIDWESICLAPRCHREGGYERSATRDNTRAIIRISGSQNMAGSTKE